MKIGMQVCGSDGDVLPILALAGGLSAAGHQVSVVVSSAEGKGYADLSRSLGLQYSEVKLVRDKNVFKGQDWNIPNMKGAFKQRAAIYKLFFEPAVDEMYLASKKLCLESDIVISHYVAFTLSVASEQFNCPHIVVHLSPLFIPTKYMSSSGRNLGRLLNALSWKTVDYVFSHGRSGAVRRLRVREGLKPVRGVRESRESKDMNLLAASEALCLQQPDWKPNVHTCGFFESSIIAEKWEMPESLRVFIEKDEPPIFMTFGSLAPYAPRRSARILIKAARFSGKRAVIQSAFEGFSDIAGDDPNIYWLKRAPYEEIFPHCSMVVHHGGAGTTRAAVLHGKPSVVVEHAFDNIYWGSRLEELGASGKLLHWRTVTPKQIAREIELVSNSPQIHERARALGATLSKKDGVATAVELIEEHFGDFDSD